MNQWAVLLDVEDKYDQILRAVEEGDIRSKIAISDVFCCNEVFRSFIIKHYAALNPEQKYRAKEKIDAWGLYEVIQTLKYKLYIMQ